MHDVLTYRDKRLQVKAALRDLRYKPARDTNSKRLQAAHLDQVSTQYQPYETLSWNLTVGVCQADADYVAATKSSPALNHHCSSLKSFEEASDDLPAGRHLPIFTLESSDMLVRGICWVLAVLVAPSVAERAAPM